MKLFGIDLQFFADEDIEIPEELEGIDRHIAIDLMRKNGLLDDKKVEVEKEPEPAVETEEQEASDSADKSTDKSTSVEEEKQPEVTPKSEPVENTELEKKPVTGEEDKKGDEADSKKTDDKKMVPYGALADERGKRKATQRELEAVKAEVERLRAAAQQSQPFVQQPPQQTANNNQQPNQEPAESMDDIVEQAALKIFQNRYHREPDDLERSDNIKLASCTYQANRNLEKIQNQQEKQAEEARQQAQSYNQFLTEQQQKDDFEEVQTAFVDELKSIPPQEQQIFASSYANCEQGHGTPQDVFVVKKFWNDVATKYRQEIALQQIEKEEPETKKAEQQQPTPPKPAKKTVEEKLSEIEKQPKANLVKGSNKTNEVSADDIAKLMNDLSWPDFEKQYPEYAKTVLES